LSVGSNGAYLALRRRGGRPDVIAKDRHHLDVA